jgi:SAM-dependent methyltransferase
MNHQFAEQYANLESWHWWFRGRQRILETVLRKELTRRELKGRDSLAIASLGCGPAEGLAWLGQFAGPGGRVVGIDREPIHSRRRPDYIDYIIGNIEALPLVEKSFDAVLALDVLEHLDDDLAGLREAARLVKPGGLLLVTVPAFPSLWGAMDVVCHHRRRYVKRTLSDLFLRAGLPEPRATYFNTLLFPTVAGVRWTRRLLGMAERARSDFNDSRPGLINEILASIFAAEHHLVPRMTLPVGVSLLATWRP